MAPAHTAELERVELIKRLEETLGKDTTKTLMAQIPPISVEQIATKEDLGMLGKDFGMLRKELDVVESRLNDKIDRLDNKIDTLETKMNGRIDRLDNKIDTLETKMNAEFTSLRSEMTLAFAEQTRKFVFLGLGMALPVWLALIVLLTSVVTGQVSFGV